MASTSSVPPTWSSIVSSSAQSTTLLRSRRPSASTGSPIARGDPLPPSSFSFQSDFDSLSLSTSEDIDTFPTLPIVDPLPHLFRDVDADADDEGDAHGQSRTPRRKRWCGRPRLPSPSPPPPPELKLQKGVPVGRDKEGRVLVLGWVEEHEIVRLLGGGEVDAADELRAAEAKPELLPSWDKDEDGLVRWRKEDFECAVCLEPFTKPHTITCGHTFCKPCISAVSTYKCPVCRQPFGVAYPNLFLKSAMEKWAGAERVV